MKLSAIILSSLLGLSSTAPVPEADRSMMVATAQWTIQKFVRICFKGDTSCLYSYAINPKDTAAIPCNYTITAKKQASRASYKNIKCGKFVISSSWSGQFGAGNGFQTLSIVRDRQIIYPAYSDAQLVNGTVVKPDQTYTPQNLP